MTSAQWLIIGLGNPGRRYARTRHNLGARVVAELRSTLKQPPFRVERALRSLVSRGDRLLAIPNTFMNDSGRVVADLRKKLRTPLDRLLVIHDDKDLAFGKIKLQQGRSSAGHRGVQSVIDALGSQAFWRLRLGIGAPPPGVETDAYVLAPFTDEEALCIRDEVIPSALATIAAHLVVPAHYARKDGF